VQFDSNCGLQRFEYHKLSLCYVTRVYNTDCMFSSPAAALTPYNSRLSEEEEEKEAETGATKGNSTTDPEGVCPCQCPVSDEEKQAEAREREIEIVFHDYLQNKVYVKR